MRHYSLTLLVFLGIHGLLNAQSAPDSIYLHSIRPIHHSAGFFSEILIQHNLSQIIDNFLDDTHVHLESTAGYDLPNPYQISFLGGSTDWTRYYFDGVRIDNPLRKGDAAFHFLVDREALEIKRAENTLHIKTGNSKAEHLKMEFTGPGIGNRVGFSDWFINNISGHQSARQREIFPLTDRPEINFQGQVSMQKELFEYPFSIEINAGSRSHLDQDINGGNTVYDETYWQANLHGTLLKTSLLPGGAVKFLTNLRSRSHDLAEFNYSRTETRSSQEWHQTIYAGSVDETTEQTIAVQLSSQSLDKNVSDFTRNILDQDGEGLHPYYQDGNQRAWTIAYHLKQKRSQSSPWYIALDFRNSWITFRPDQSTFSTQLYYLNTNRIFHSLSTTDWQSRDFHGGVLENSWTIGFEKSKGSKAYLAKGGLQLNGVILESKSIVDFKPYIDLGFSWQLADHWTVGSRGYFRINPFNIEHLQYLSPDYLEGQVYFWNDENEDQIFSENERGTKKSSTGGKFRLPTSELGASSTLHLEFPITYHSGTFQLTVLPQYRQYRNTWHTEYNGDLEEFGRFETLNDRSFFLPESTNTQYRIVSYPTARMGTESWFFNQPFYAGATLRAQKETEDWFFTASFTANMMVGASSFGNGVLHNQVNILSESTADPNLINNQVGRLDGERSFISRWLLRKKWKKNRFLTLQIKYKDGQSFANYDHFLFQEETGNSVAFVQREVKGDNPLNGDRGRREDFLLNVDCRYRHIFSFNDGILSFEIHGYNLLDFGNETLEYTFGNINGYDRAPLELQVPRTFMISIAYEWK